MIDFAKARQVMVDSQVRTNDVTDLRLQGVMLQVPRERFVPADKQALAYQDLDLAVLGERHKRRYLLKPMVLAKLIQAAEIAEGDHVLTVGCSSGYSAAVLSRLAGSVVGVEEEPELVRMAKTELAALGAENVTVATGPLTEGCAPRAPYDAIILDGATEVPPCVLLDQLAEGGRLVAVIKDGPVGKATVFRRTAGHVSAHPVFNATAPLLPGFEKPPQFVF